MSQACSKCSKNVPSGKFCIECGARLSADLVLSDETEKTEINQFSIFDYEKRYDGTYIIKKLTDPYAFVITIPASVIAIENGAFENSRVMEISIPNGLRYIGERAFANCKHLKKINIPQSVVQIGKEAFLNCDKLDLVLPSSVDVDENALKGTLSDPSSEVLTPSESELDPTNYPSNNLYIRNGKSVIIGEFPQTVKSSNVEITSKIDDRGYYLGSDGCYYAKQIV